MLRSFLPAFLAFLLPVAAAAQEPVRVDPMVRALARPALAAELAEGARVLGAQLEPGASLPAGGFAVFREAPGAEPVAGVFLRVEGAGTVAALRARGVRVGSVVGRLVTARVPLSLLPELETVPGVLTVELARVLPVRHDSSMAAIGVAGLRQQVDGIWTGATGAGVLVGIMDTGLDVAHQDFVDAAGQTRVAALWDQTRGNTPPPGFDYGRVCERAQLQQVVAGVATACPQSDAQGHGTHVAGTAAGDGSATGNGEPAYRYAGVAPAAELLVVNGWLPGFAEDRVVDALVWMRDRARALGRPLVVNLSIGAQTGPHDGTLPLEEAIDALSEPGFIVVTAAGNDGANANTTPLLPGVMPRIHARGFALPGGTSSWTLELRPYTPASGAAVRMQLWHEAEDPVTITVVRPDGSSAAAGPGQLTEADGAGGQIVISNALTSTHPDGDQVAEIWLARRGASGAPAPGNWTIQVTTAAGGSGQPFDLWVYQDALDGTAAHVAFGRAGFDNRYVVATPGTAGRSVTAAAFAGRLCWPRAGGMQTCYTEREAIGDLARFSGAGPTRDDRPKPDIAAPGMAILSARSAPALFGSTRITPDGAHAAMEGTSMATPHVTGAIALLLEQRPNLTAEAVKQLLSFTAAQDEFTSRVYDGGAGGSAADWWGVGKLDVSTALPALEGGAPVAEVHLDPGSARVPVGGQVKLAVRLTGAEGQPVFAPVTWTSLEPARAAVNAVGIVQGLSPGQARVVASADGVADTAAVEVVPPAVLTVAASAVRGAEPVRAPAGAVIPLQRLALTVAGMEPMLVTTLGFQVTSTEAEAALALYRDLNADGQVDPGEPRLARRELAGAGEERVVVALTAFRIGPDSTAHLLVAVEASGASPEGGSYSVEVVPAEILSLGLVSGSRNPATTSGELAVHVSTTFMQGQEALTLSENPVRTAPLILNFSERPTLLAVYTAGGRRVADLLPRMEEDRRLAWDLTDDDGRPMTPAVYLLLARVDGQLHQVKLFVLTPRGESDAPEIVHVR